MRKYILFVVAIAISSLFGHAKASTTVHFCDVGQGDSTIVQSDRSILLIDTGLSSARTPLLKQLSTFGVGHIDILLLTHPHEDHDGNLGYLIENYSIGKLLIPEYVDDEEDYGGLLRRAIGRGTQILYPSVGDKLTVGDATVTVLSAADPEQFPNDKNLWSIVTKIEDGETSIIVCGDAEDINEFAMIEAGLDLDADILRIGHHGSSTSTTGAFLDAVKPDVAIISCGADNPYSHPHAETLDSLFDRQIVVFRTDLDGTITVTIDAVAYKISKEK